MTATHPSLNNTSCAISRASTYGRYVGRVGALAAALGIGLMVATSPGIASADSTSTATSTEGGADTTTESNTGETGTGTTGTGTGTAVSATESSTGNASSTADTTSATTGDTSTSGATSSSIQVAPGVTISANSIKIDSETITVGLEDLKPSADAKPPAPEGSTPPVVPAPETGQTIPTLGKTESKSGFFANANPTGSPSSTSPQALKSPVAEVDDAIKNVKQLATKATESTPGTAAQTFTATAVSNALTTTAANAAVSPVAPTLATPTETVTGVVGFLNQVVTNLLNPFLAPAPNTPEPFTPVVWAVLAWVRRNVYNEAPTLNVAPATMQNGQTVTGILATDPEGDPLTYTVTGATQVDSSTWDTDTGRLTIDQATGRFTFTPNDINYDEPQPHSFTVSVTDGRTNLLSLFGVPHSDEETVSVTVQNPQAERVILGMPDWVTQPKNPRFSEDGQTIFFSGTPTAGGRAEIYQIDADDVTGETVECVTCNATPTEVLNLEKPVPFYDGTGRIVVLINRPNPPIPGRPPSFDPTYSIFEPAGYNGVGSPARLVPVVTPGGGGLVIINRQREMRPSPDGDYVLFTRIVIGQTGNFQALPIVGALTPNGDHYDVTNARVVWPTGESKQWTPDGKGVIIQGGAFDAGNVDDILVDLSGQTGTKLYPGSDFLGTRVTGNLDYDEDIDMSPNMQWITVGSLRGEEALTPMTRIVRQNFLPFYVGAAIYDQYADGQVRNVSNQNWLVAIEDDLNREDGIPLFLQDDPATVGVDEGDGWASRSMPSWNADGTAVTFWESGVNEPTYDVPVTASRIVVANLKYTTSVGPVSSTNTVFNPSAFPDVTTYVAQTTPLPPTGTYNGVGGGTAVVSDVVDATTHQTTRTVTYTNYVNEDGLILNGTEKSTYGPSQTSATYLADIDVTDATGILRGGLNADAVYTLLPTQHVSGYITSVLDGVTQTIPNPTNVEVTKQGA
jgi:hypothetical protein